jgi:hypothetical protein
MPQNIIKCPDCHKILIGEELNSHECTFEVIEIPVEFYYDVKEPECDTLIAKGLNGKYYRLIHYKEPESPEMKRPSESPEDETESSLDGYFEGPNHDLSWHNVDEEFKSVCNKSAS